jgi:hypothetical protein
MSFYHRSVLIALIIMTGRYCLSQNLVANGSFEDVNTCTEFDAQCAPEAWKTTSSLLPVYGGILNRRVEIIVQHISANR